MKADIPSIAMHTITVMLLGSMVVVGWVQNDRLRRELSDWKQAYLDCQASMWMRDPTWLASTNQP